MEINFTPKAPDIYQVQAAPTNKYDMAVKSLGIICCTTMVLGYFGLLGYWFFSKDKKKD